MSWWPNPDNHYLLDEIDEEYEDTDEPEDDPDLRATSESAILDDAKREMFGDDADLLPDDMGAK